MSTADKILEAIRLGLGPVGDANPAAHLRMYLREVDVEIGSPTQGGEEFFEIAPTLTCAGFSRVSLVITDQEVDDRSTVELSAEGARRLAASLLLAAFDAEELAKFPRRPARTYHPPEVNAEIDRGDLEPEKES